MENALFGNGPVEHQRAGIDLFGEAFSHCLILVEWQRGELIKQEFVIPFRVEIPRDRQCHSHWCPWMPASSDMTDSVKDFRCSGALPRVPPLTRTVAFFCEARASRNSAFSFSRRGMICVMARRPSAAAMVMAKASSAFS